MPEIIVPELTEGIIIYELISLSFSYRINISHHIFRIKDQKKRYPHLALQITAQRLAVILQEDRIQVSYS